MIDRILNAYRSRKLALSLRRGRAQLGRAGATIAVAVPMRARMSMKVARADGTIEDHGAIGEGTFDASPEYLDSLAKAAE